MRARYELRAVLVPDNGEDGLIFEYDHNTPEDSDAAVDVRHGDKLLMSCSLDDAKRLAELLDLFVSHTRRQLADDERERTEGSS